MTAAAGAPFAVFLAAKGTALLVYSPPHMRGRIYSISWGLSSLFYLLGIASAGLAGDAVGLAVINIDAIAYLAAGLVALWAANQVTSSHPQSRDPV